MQIVITENRDKSSRVVNGQEATLVSNQNNTLLIQYRDGQCAFLYSVTHALSNDACLCHDDLQVAGPEHQAPPRLVGLQHSASGTGLRHPRQSS